MKIVLENERLVTGYIHDIGDKELFYQKALNTESNDVFCCQTGWLIFFILWYS